MVIQRTGEYPVVNHSVSNCSNSVQNDILSVLFVGMSDEDIMELNLPTGIPILYELDKNLKPVKPMQFLGDKETVRKAMEAVAAQGKAKK